MYYPNINHTNIKEQLQIAEERVMNNNNPTEEDMNWYFKLLDKDAAYSSSIGHLLIDLENTINELEILSEDIEKITNKVDKISKIFEIYEKELPDAFLSEKK